MAARVMLLLLAVGGFIALWSGDRRPPGWVRGDACIPGRRDDSRQATAVAGTKNPQVARRTRKPDNPHRPPKAVSPSDRQTGSIPGRPHPLVANRERRPGTDRSQTGGFVESARFGEPPDGKISNAGVPLPGGITPGQFRVVRSDGRVLRLHVSPAELVRRGMPHTERPRNFYLLHDGRIRWYFIRVESVQEELANVPNRLNVTGESAKRPPVVARKPPFIPDAMRWLKLSKAGLWQPMCDALRTAALRVSAQAARSWETAIGGAAERLRDVAVHIRRRSAGPGPFRR